MAFWESARFAEQLTLPCQVPSPEALPGGPRRKRIEEAWARFPGLKRGSCNCSLDVDMHCVEETGWILWLDVLVFHMQSGMSMHFQVALWELMW